MFLTDKEKAMLDGQRGPGLQKAMDLLVKLGECFDAEKMAEVDWTHTMLDGVPHDFLQAVTEGAKSGPRVTLHPGWQPEKWKEIGLTVGSRADTFIERHNQRLQIAERLKWDITETCAEYLLGYIPRKGDVIAMTGTCMQVANNSLYGALVNRNGDLSTLASAVTGVTPYMGLMLPENRYAHVLVKLEKGLDFNNWSEMHYGCLGYFIGNQVLGYKNVVIDGLPENLSFEYARAVVISHPVSGAVTLVHIVGVTPEAPTLEAVLPKKPEQTIVVGKRDLQRTWEELNVHKGDVVEHVAIGCPHCSIEEIRHLGSLIKGRKLKASLAIGASNKVVARAKEMGYTRQIEKAGGVFLNCCIGVGDPFISTYYAADKVMKSSATNGARAAHYQARTMGVDVFFGTEEECIEAAVTGRWQGKEPKW